jgi:uncharacterized protein
MDLSAAESRILGCLLEKQRTVPDQYPLTLNALRLACNQSTNRDPVVAYDDALLREALHRLERRGFVRLASGRGSRAPKYRHLLADALPMDAEETAVMCVLMLRGAQTPGELKQRTDRMHAFADLGEVAQTLERLIARGLAQRLDRRPGQKEERFRELLSEDAAQAGADPEPRSAAVTYTSGEPIGRGDTGADGHWVADDESSATAGTSVSEAAFEELRARVERLEHEVAELRGSREHERASSGAEAAWARE